MAVLLVSALVALALAFGGPQAPSEQVVVLPGKDGHVGMVVVERAGERHVLDQAYAASRSGEPRPVRLSPGEVARAFGPALAALPARPASFVMYFVSGTDKLTQESDRALQAMLAELQRRPVPDIEVIAHTDTVGESEANDRLSAQRAESMKKVLVGIGIGAERIRTAGRGERELLVPTADNTDEPRNRRVEISVR